MSTTLLTECSQCRVAALLTETSVPTENLPRLPLPTLVRLRDALSTLSARDLGIFTGLSQHWSEDKLVIISAIAGSGQWAVGSSISYSSQDIQQSED